MQNDTQRIQQEGRPSPDSNKEGGRTEKSGESAATAPQNKKPHRKPKDLSGMKFGRLKVLRRSSLKKGKEVWWVCECECGATKTTCTHSLNAGNTRSCGCLQMDSVTKHGHTLNGVFSRTYKTWAGMVSRCTSPADSGYSNYGGRGILVCERWLDFRSFLEDMGERPPNTSLDRKENSKGYSKENCRWATPKQQGRNRSDNRWVTIGNRTLCVAEWLEVTGLSRTRFLTRIRKGLDVPEAQAYQENLAS